MSLSSSISSEETYSMNEVYDTNEYYDLPVSDMLELNQQPWVYLTEGDGTPAIHHEYLDIIYTHEDNDMLLNYDPTTLYFNPYPLCGSKYACEEQLQPVEDEIIHFMNKLNQLDNPFYFDDRAIDSFIDYTQYIQEDEVTNVLAPPSQPDTSVASTESEANMYDVTPDINPYCNMSL